MVVFLAGILIAKCCKFFRGDCQHGCGLVNAYGWGWVHGEGLKGF